MVAAVDACLREQMEITPPGSSSPLLPSASGSGEMPVLAPKKEPSG
jgi:hypothetical protein